MISIDYAAGFSSEERNVIDQIQKYVEENKCNLSLDLASIELLRYDSGKMAVKYCMPDKEFIVSEGESKDSFDFLDLSGGDTCFVDSFIEYAKLSA